MVTTITPSRNKGQEFLKVAEVAAVTGLCTRTIRRAVNRGELAHVRIGGVILIPKTALEARQESAGQIETR